MKVRVNAAHIKGELQTPPSKSHMQRVVAAALLSKQTSIIIHPGYSNDCKSALRIARQLGATVVYKNDTVEITGKQNNIQDTLDCGEAGLSIRMFSAIAALHHNEITLTGRGSLLERPMHFFEQSFPDFGITCNTNNGKLPIQVKGPMQAATAHVNGSVSSQYLTGLLMALATVDGDSLLHVKDLKSKPYIDLTLAVLNDFGVTITHNNYETFFIRGQQTYTGKKIEIEGDWSSASFPLVAAAIGGTIKMSLLKLDSKQADKNILNAIELAGAKVGLENGILTVSKDKLYAFHFDATDCPDLFPPLMVLASQCKGVSKIKGVTRLYHKESNRALVLRDEFSKVGVDITLKDDFMLVDGAKTLNSATIDAHNDHRIAMAACIIAVANAIEIQIIGAESVNKSYPDFYSDMKKIGYKHTVLET